MGMAQQVSDFHPDILEEGIFRIARKAFDYHKDIQILFSSDEYLCSSDRYLVISGSTGRFILSNLNFDQIVNANANDYRVRGLKAGLIPGARQVSRPADEFFWRYAFQLSAGRLLPSCRSNDVVQLRHWPNFTRLPITPNSYRIAALLTARPTSIDTAQRLLQVSHAEINQFYSAAWLAGYTRLFNRPLDTPVQFKTHEHIGVIRMLLNRFRRPSR
ncbi:hypothetical protein OUO13_16880 [Oceanospirillaceae bacterium G-43]|uniref:Uncharacterized protein n=2 Tax=Parathalassolituus penaei TaxID=2997323 RepID=A0A9X3EG28_9GAMM|nr:hypothetical protein [Parathalassolituus penaei]